MKKRFPFPGLPTGWYAVATSREVKPGKVVSQHYFDREIIIYRTQDGEARVADAHCPHLGAHLGRVGEIDGDTLKCRFHGFKYDGLGKCVATAYEGPVPPRARLHFWETREQNGLILAWFDLRGRPPLWEVPEQDETGWTAARWHTFRIPTHPQETTENSVDFGHFTEIHGFVDGSILEPIVVEDERLTTTYQAYRPLPLPSLSFTKVAVQYAVTVRGLGYSQVQVRIDALGLQFRVFVLPVPIDEEHIDLRLGLCAQTKLGPLWPLARYIGHGIVKSEVEQDLDVWTYKTYHERPALAKGDGPVAEYRRYVKQFYIDPEEVYELDSE